MSGITTIVLTGGPCAGKTTALGFLKTELEKFGVKVLINSEAATELMSSGVSPESVGSYEFHARLFARQLKLEEELLEKAKNSDGKVVILLDRGLLDSRAYVDAEAFEKYSSLHGMSEALIRDRYDAVFHLVTAADGAEMFYSNKTNAVRSEGLELARKLDESILALWVGTAHLRIIDNSTDFEGKLDRLLAETLAAVGIPEPLEIERKFLIEYPDLDLLNNMKLCRRVAIRQAYLTTPEEGRFRVRKRGEGTDAVYIRTVKRKLSDLRRIEEETRITEEEYLGYLEKKDCVEGIIAKDRYCIAWKGRYYELDIYPFWADRATLEIELLDENEPFDLPDFLSVIRDVSHEKQYRNKTLSVIYKNLFLHS